MSTHRSANNHLHSNLSITGDIEDNRKQDDAFMMVAQLDSDENEHLAVQSEFGAERGINQFKTFEFESLESHLEELRVSDHPHLDPSSPVYQNSTDHRMQPKSTTVRVRRSSAGDEATLICDFGDFKTQELISQPLEQFSSEPPTSLSSFRRNGRPGQDVLNYSTNSESYHGNSSAASSHISYSRTNGQLPEHSVLQRLTSEPPTSGGIYQNYIHPANRGAPPLMPRPVKPFSPAMFNPLPNPINHQVYQNQPPIIRVPSKPSPPPRVPPKHNLPPPYRPPPLQSNVSNVQRNYHPLYNNTNNNGFPQQPLQAFFMPPIEEDSACGNMMMFHVNAGSRFDRHPMMLGMPPTTTSGAHSSSDGGSHDSHNDSGYCAVRLGGGCGGSSAAGSGGPSPSLSGKDQTWTFHSLDAF